jgi:bifunctional ADP-heptose synthase (sugar kinase/adenylyltransferase)
MFIRVDEGDDNVDRFVLNGINSNLIKTANLVIISDYNKGFLSNEDIVNISKLSNSVVIDTKKVLTKEIIESVSYVKLNEVEYQNNHELVNLHPEKFIVTLGMNGAKHMGNIYPSDNPVQTMDVSGAGDTFTASFSYRYYFVNGNVSDSIIFANKMASKVVSKRGVSVP